MSVYADERYQVYQEHERRARKQHVCDACGDPILPRHRYFKISWVFDGRADSVKRCLGCQAVHLHLRKLGQKDDMWPSETLSCGEEYTEHWGKPPPEHIARLAFLSPEEKQALVFRVFRTPPGAHIVAGHLAEACVIAVALGITDPLTELQDNIGLPLVVDGSERFLYRHLEHGDVREPQALYQDGFYEIRQPYECRSALEWAAECGPGLLCGSARLAPQQGPLQKRRVWG